MKKKLKKIELSDRPLIEKKLQSTRFLCCEYSFQNLFIWASVYDTRWAIENDILYLLYAEENSLLMPIPEPPLNKLIEIPEKFNLDKNSLHISHVEEDYIKSNPDVHDHFEVVNDENFIDYVHLIERLVELKGTKLAKKKNLISQFTRNNPEYQCLKISPQIKNECLNFAEYWLSKQNENHIGLEHEYLALQSAFTEVASKKMKILIANH